MSFKSGNIIQQYTLTRKLGSGRFSSVWAAHHEGSPVAIKIYLDQSDMKYYKNEVHVLSTISKFPENERQKLLFLINAFVHVAANDRPQLFPCIVFNLGQSSIRDLIDFCRKENGAGLPIWMVKQLMREIFTAINILHKNNIIHADIKPENIIINQIPSNDMDIDNLSITLADFGCSKLNGELISHNIGTIGYVAPEVLIKSSNYSFPVDIWSAFSICFELVTGDYLFDLYSECSIVYGGDLCDYNGDDGSDEGSEDKSEDKSDDGSDNGSEDGSNTMDSEELGSDEIDGDESDESDDDSDESELSDYTMIYRQLMFIMKVVGKPPRSFAELAPHYYNGHGKLIHNPDIKPISISELLSNNYKLESEVCTDVESFMTLGLKYEADKRITAGEILKNKWLLTDC